MKTRFLADADLNRAILNGVLRREPALDFLSAQAAALRGLPDPEVLALAARLGRVLVSHDVGTLPAHYSRFRLDGHHSAGVFLISQTLDVGAAIEEILIVWLASDAREWENRLVWLPL